MKHALNWLMFTTLTCGWGAVWAGEDAVVRRVRDCASEVDDVRRLACYDSAIGREASDSVGLTGPLLSRKRREGGLTDTAPKKLSARVVGISRSPNSKFVITLDNGQVWSQQEMIDFPVEVGDDVTIQSGLWGALWLVDARGNRETRVTRVR